MDRNAQHQASKDVPAPTDETPEHRPVGSIPTNDLTLPAINDGGSWFIEGACLSILTDRAVEVPFPQAFVLVA